MATNTIEKKGTETIFSKKMLRLIGIVILGVQCLTFRGCMVEPFLGLLIQCESKTTAGSRIAYYHGTSGYADEVEVRSLKYEYQVGGKKHKATSHGNFAETTDRNNIIVEYFTKIPSICRIKGEGAQNVLTWFIFDYLRSLPLMTVYLIFTGIGIALLTRIHRNVNFSHARSVVILRDNEQKKIKGLRDVFFYMFLGYLARIFPLVVLPVLIGLTLKLTRSLRLPSAIYIIALFFPGLNALSARFLLNEADGALERSKEKLVEFQ